MSEKFTDVYDFSDCFEVGDADFKKKFADSVLAHFWEILRRDIEEEDAMNISFEPDGMHLCLFDGACDICTQFFKLIGWEKLLEAFQYLEKKEKSLVVKRLRELADKLESQKPYPQNLQ
jgi:hypothetical protein